MAESKWASRERLQQLSDDEITDLYDATRGGVKMNDPADWGMGPDEDVTGTPDSSWSKEPDMDWYDTHKLKHQWDMAGINHMLPQDKHAFERRYDAIADEYRLRQQKEEEPAAAAAEPEPAKEPFQEADKSDDHQAAEDNFTQPGATSSATDSYQSAFARAVAAGREMTAGDYLRQRADDKKAGVGRFTHFLKDSNTLAAHEGNRAAQTAIKRAEYEELDPPQLIDPGDLYDRYKGDIDDI